MILHKTGPPLLVWYELNLLYFRSLIMQISIFVIKLHCHFVYFIDYIKFLYLKGIKRPSK